jgi:LPXTG-site transpeptidase (sortase) family protein
MVSRRWPLLALTAGVLLVTAAAWLAVNPPRRPDPAAAARPLLPAPIITSGVFASPVAPPGTEPLGYRVRIPALQVDLPLVEGDGLNVPLNKAALYPGLKAPGEGGRSLIYAHARPGMFEPLFSVRVGEKVIIQRSDGTDLKYVITKTFPRWPANDGSVLQPADHEELVLLTCSTYNPNDPRIVVFAEPATG